GAGLLRLLPGVGGGREGALDGGERLLGAGADEGGDLGLPGPATLPLGGLAARDPLGLGGPLERGGPAGEGPGPLLDRAQREAGLGLRGPGAAGGLGGAVPLGGGGGEVLLGALGLLLGDLEAGGELGELPLVLLPRGDEVGDGGADALRLRLGGAGEGPEAPELLGDAGEPGVRGAEGGEGAGDH